MAGNTMASTLGDGVVYSKTDTFIKEVSFSDDFHIDKKGLYEATLTDLKNTKPFDNSSLDVKSGSKSLGSLSSPGAFKFEAGPGEYAVSLFASVTETKVSEEEKREMLDDERKAYKAAGDTWWHGLSREQKNAKKAMWNTWTDEQWQAKREEQENRHASRVEEQLASMNQGEYDIQINEVSAVPVPAAVWLFVSGLLGLAGVARKQRSIR
jgi:hypothetical protein